jgi:hypothetical protein
MQRRSKRFLVIAACVLSAALSIDSCRKQEHGEPCKAGRVFYIDGQTGDDGYDGRSPEKAVKTLSAVNSTLFEPGDTILFKAGTAYQGQLKPGGSGSLVEGRPHPIVIDRYGDGDMPRIDAEGQFESALYLHNVEYWEINNLELTNTGPGSKARRKGVYVHIEDFGTASHIYLRNLYIHDVNGTNRKKDGHSGGIRWHTFGKNVPSRLNGFLVENCHIVRCERDGIMGSGHIQRGVDWYPSLNVVIRENLIEEVPGDGIVPIACDGTVVERNIMRNCTRRLPEGDAAAGMWAWACDNTVIQFNEVSDHKAPWDAQGFDSDWNCRNTIIQYNYSHDNEGGFLLICNNGGAGENIGINTGTIVRYNISVNDGLRSFPTGRGGYFSPSFHISGPTKDTKIYNNIIYVPEKPGPQIDRTMIKMDNWGGPWPEDTWFANNIFYVEGETNYDWGESKNHRFEKNLFFGTHNDGPEDPHAVLQDPLFVSTESVGADWETLRGFMLKKGSPCIRSGIPISQNGGRDFWGHSLPELLPVSIGAHEFGTDLLPNAD